MSTDNKIDFNNPDVYLFNETAAAYAKLVSDSGKDVNKSTQLRRFYDEVSIWYQRFQVAPETFDKNLPLIKMINAKVAYAKGRNPALVDDNFLNLIKLCLSKVNDIESFYNFKLFFEAFLGFYKIYK